MNAGLAVIVQIAAFVISYFSRGILHCIHTNGSECLAVPQEAAIAMPSHRLQVILNLLHQYHYRGHTTEIVADKVPYPVTAFGTICHSKFNAFIEL
jgi:hypothetical protein